MGGRSWKKSTQNASGMLWVDWFFWFWNFWFTWWSFRFNQHKQNSNKKYIKNDFLLRENSLYIKYVENQGSTYLFARLTELALDMPNGVDVSTLNKWPPERLNSEQAYSWRCNRINSHTAHLSSVSRQIHLSKIIRPPESPVLAFWVSGRVKA